MLTRNPSFFRQAAVFAALLSLLAPGAAARAAGESRPGDTSRGESVGGPVTPFSIDVDLRDLPTLPPPQPGDPIRAIPRRVYPQPGLLSLPARGAPGRDPLAAAQEQAPIPAVPGAFATPIVNVAGQGYSNVEPPDTVGDVGPNHFIQSVNASSTAFTVYSKAGALLSGPTALVSLAPTGDACKQSGGDPLVLYDRLADRWFLLEFANTGNHLCMYISKTANPVTGGWWFYRYDTTVFPDYPHCGIWSDSFYCTTNENSPTIYAFDRANMLTGAAARAAQKFTVPALANYQFNVVTPANHEGFQAPAAGEPIIILRPDDDEAHVASPVAGSDYLDLWSLHIDWTTPASSLLTTLPKIAIADYNSWLADYVTFNAVPQPGVAGLLDPLREPAMQKLVYHNFNTYESLVGNFVTNINTARTGSAVNTGVRWFELRRAPVNIGNWVLQQEGTFGPGDTATNHWMGALSVDQDGDIALGYSITKTSAPTLFPGLKYTGRLWYEAAGAMTQGESNIVAGTGSNNGGLRWGDYAAMGLDPSDNCTFWFTSEYEATGGQWRTQIASFRFNVPPGTTAITQGKAATNVQINWGAVTGAKAYMVQRANMPAFTSSTVIGNGLTAPGFSDTGELSNTTSRYYLVNGYSGCGGFGQ